MNQDTEDQQALPAATRVEKLYLNALGHPVPPVMAVRVIVNVLDHEGNIIKSTMIYNPVD